MQETLLVVFTIGSFPAISCPLATCCFRLQPVILKVGVHAISAMRRYRGYSDRLDMGVACEVAGAVG
jgi:hypothetical protein